MVEKIIIHETLTNDGEFTPNIPELVWVGGEIDRSKIIWIKQLTNNLFALNIQLLFDVKFVLIAKGEIV